MFFSKTSLICWLKLNHVRALNLKTLELFFGLFVLVSSKKSIEYTRFTNEGFTLKIFQFYCIIFNFLLAIWIVH